MTGRFSPHAPLRIHLRDGLADVWHLPADVPPLPPHLPCPLRPFALGPLPPASARTRTPRLTDPPLPSPSSAGSYRLCPHRDPDQGFTRGKIPGRGRNPPRFSSVGPVALTPRSLDALKHADGDLPSRPRLLAHVVSRVWNFDPLSLRSAEDANAMDFCLTVPLSDREVVRPSSCREGEPPPSPPRPPWSSNVSSTRLRYSLSWASRSSFFRWETASVPR